MLSDLAFALAGNQFEIHVVCSRMRYDDATERLPAKEIVRGANVHRVWTTRFGRGNLMGRAIDYCSYYVATCVMLLFLVKRNDIVVVKTDPPLLSIPVALVCRLKRARMLNWLQDLFPEVAIELGVRFPAVLYRWLTVLRNRSLKQATMNIAIGTLMAERIAANGVQRQHITVIPNWASEGKIRPVNHADNDLRKAWGLEGKFVVAYSGNMGRGHSFDTILEAAKRLLAEPDIVFLFVGDGAKKTALMKAAANLNIVFRPYQPIANLSCSLGAGDVHLVSLLPALEGLIVPSKFYGILAAARIPVFIGARDGELATLIEQQQIGFSVGDDADALVQVIQRLHTEPAQCYELGHRAYHYYRSRCSLQSASRDWQQVLLSV